MASPRKRAVGGFVDAFSSYDDPDMLEDEVINPLTGEKTTLKPTYALPPKPTAASSASTAAVAQGKDPSLVGYPIALVYDLALGEQSKDVLFESYGLDPYKAMLIEADPVFQRQLAAAKEEVADGASFKVKAKLMSDALLPVIWRVVNDPDTPAAVKVDISKTMFKMAGHEPKQSDAALVNANNGNVEINIMLTPRQDGHPSNRPEKVIDGTATRIDGGDK